MHNFRNQLPNGISLLRVVLAPVLVAWIVAKDFDRALYLSLFAGWTDWLDGFLARRWGISSSTGALLDPLGDKVMLTSIYPALAYAGAVPWSVVAVVIGRDLFIVLGAGLLYLLGRSTKFPPSQLGKLSTCVQIAAVVAVLARWPGQEYWLGAVVLLAMVSGADYARLAWRMQQRGQA